MSTIKDVISNVEEQERLQLPSRILPSTLERLEEAVYEADDLFDEIATIAQRKKLSGNNKVSKEVHLFFSRFNQFYYALTKSREIKKIGERLDAIAKNHRDFGTMQGQAATVGNHSRETHSFVCEKDVIIGRDEDKRRVIDMLVDDATVEEAVSVVSIVGIGGLGKTALAKLVYNDVRIQREFQLTMWVCVSDDFNVREILSKIFTEATNESIDNRVSMQCLQKNLQRKLEGQKYLLVLDDIWNEVPDNWHMLRNLLIGGRGSRIIVTTRSMRVATIVGSHQTHELKGLSDEDSWKLFEKMTLEPGQVQLEAHLVDIGKVIVRKCANVPLAIRVIGSLLQGQGEYTWQNLKHIDFANLKEDENGGIIPVLKISYNYLPSHLKSCFTFCAVFPKDYQIMKEDLIYLWMAQGFIWPSNGQSFEDLGEEYFVKLLQKCFFQDVKRNRFGVIKSCKMHDLIHDLAKGVSGIGIKSSSDDISSLNNNNNRHIYIDDTIVQTKNVECYLAQMKRLRTCLGCRSNFVGSYDWLPKMRYLRVLELIGGYGVKKLPSMIGQLVHLRYLDLSGYQALSMLPNSITQLFNLHTLNLVGCKSLIELPRELSKLVNLRRLDISGCYELRYMPSGMNRMTCLHKLTMFVLGGTNNASCSSSVAIGKLGDMKYLNNLRGEIEINMRKGWTYDAAEVKEGGYIIDKSLLYGIVISWESVDENAESLLEGLQPHPDVKKLSLVNYPGVRFPRWGDGGSLRNLSSPLPNLVKIDLAGCKGLKHVPMLSQLRHLKVLELRDMEELEYMESRHRDGAAMVSGGTHESRSVLFFPSLERLFLLGLPKLKGWWKASSHSDSDTDAMESEIEIAGFPCLSYLSILFCGNMMNFPSLPKLEKLIVLDSNKVMGYFDSLPEESFQHLSSLSLRQDGNIERLSTLEVFQSGRLSSLRSLEIHGYDSLKSMSGRGVWEHFTALEALKLSALRNLEMEDNEGDEDPDMPWRCLAPSLHSLKLASLPKMGKLPMGMRNLTALSSLDIQYCDNLEEIPVWIRCLTSLQDLSILQSPKIRSLPEEMSHLTSLNQLSLSYCSAELRERCQERTGADWHIIQHIPTFRYGC